MQRKWATILLSSLIFLNGCQIMPHAKGLQSPLWQAQTYQRQDQVEVQWKQQSLASCYINSKGRCTGYGRFKPDRPAII